MNATPKVLKDQMKEALKKLHGPGWQQTLAERIGCSRSLISTFYTTEKVHADIEDASLVLIQELRHSLQEKIDTLAQGT